MAKFHRQWWWILLFSACGHAYPDYLLTRSNCWTELNTNEVIMNAQIVSVAESDDPQMQIVVRDDETTFGVRTTNPKTDKDYHYVMDVIQGDCFFPKGSCEHQTRITGRSNDWVQLERVGHCKLQAGWAAGHEAVRLTPVLELGNDEAEEAEETTDVASEEATTLKGNDEHQEEIIHDSIMEDPSDHRRDRREQWRNSLPQKKARDHRHPNEYEQNLLLYSIGFEGVGIAWSDYWRGAVVLVLSPCLTILLCLKLTERSNAKRGRDL